jgi:hypothetical protein
MAITAPCKPCSTRLNHANDARGLSIGVIEECFIADPHALHHLLGLMAAHACSPQSHM